MEYFLITIIFAGVASAFVVQRQRTVVRTAQDTVHDHEQEVKTLRKGIQERDSRIEELSAEMARIDALLLKLREAEVYNDSRIADLERDNKEHERTVTSLSKQLTTIEQESIQSKALFSTISNVAYDLVFVLDGEGTIVALNRSGDSLFGHTNPIGENITDVIDSPDLHGIVERAVNEDESIEDQFRMDERYYRARTQVMRYESQQVFIGIALQDITQLVKLSSARRDLVMNISHELGTPIQKIRMIIDNLELDQTRPKRKTSIASLRQIDREAESLRWIVQEMHDLSMIESGQAIMKFVAEPLIEIVDEAVERLDKYLDDNQLTITRHIPARMYILCDRDHIRRVLTNLIRNAIKWSPENETITISARNVGEDVSISVFDNGPGVPDELVGRIFERFYQVDPARSGGGGSGLGLAICKHIVEAHGGQIWAEGNSQGSGGRFLFTLLSANDDVSYEDYDDEPENVERLPAPPQEDDGEEIEIVADDES